MQKGQPQKCWIPFCASEKSDTVRLFHPPLQSPELCQQWKDTFSHLEDFDPFNILVCSKHFEDRFIIKEDIIEEGGIKISIPRTNWTLKEGAIPTIFDGLEGEEKSNDDADVNLGKSVGEDNDSGEGNGMLNLATDIFESSEEQSEDVEMESSLSEQTHASPVLKKKMGRPKKPNSKYPCVKVSTTRKRGRKPKPKESVDKTKPSKQSAKARSLVVAKKSARTKSPQEWTVDLISVASSPSLVKKPLKRQAKRESSRKASKISRIDDSAELEDATEVQHQPQEVRKLRGSSRNANATEAIERDTVESSTSLPKANDVRSEPRINSVRIINTHYQSTSAKTTTAKESTLRRFGQTGYDLNYIYQHKQKFQLPRLNKWVFELLTDDPASKELIYVGEMISRNEELILQRVIKIFDDLTFKIETNGSDVTSMFSERGTRINTLDKLQDIINDLAAFKVCQGWTGFESVVDFELGKKVGGIWYAKDCECLKLKSIRCGPCGLLGAALMFRRARINQIRGSTGLSLQDQINLLPADDPLRLQFQVEELTAERNELKRKLGISNVDRIRAVNQLDGFNYKSGLIEKKSSTGPASKKTPQPCPASKKTLPAYPPSRKISVDPLPNKVPPCPASKKNNFATKILPGDIRASSGFQLVTNGGRIISPLPPSLAKPASSSIVRPKCPFLPSKTANPRQSYTPLVRPPVSTPRTVRHNVVLSGETISEQSLLNTLQQMHPGKTIKIVNPSASSNLTDGDADGKKVVLLRKNVTPSKLPQIGNTAASETAARNGNGSEPTFITLD